jgi:transposase
VKGSYIPCKKIRILREYTRYRYKLVSCRSSEKNRYHQMTDSQKYRMRLVRAHMDYITAEINDIDSMIESMISSDPDYENAIQFLMTIPGVKRDSAITIISETGIDMSQFCSSKRLCCWAGLVPGRNESGGKKKSVRIARAGVYLKPALVQCAHAAVKSEKSPYYKKK